MKRILIFLILFSSLAASSQTEIWGWKRNGGIYNGGFTYKIDSATQKIKILQRLSGYTGEYSYPQVYHDANQKEYITANKNIVLKYLEESDKVDFKFNNLEPIGNLILMPDGFIYARERRGLVKINPQTLEAERLEIKFYDDFYYIDSISGENFDYERNDKRISKMIQVDDHHLLWNQKVQLGTVFFFNYLLIYNIDSNKIVQCLRIQNMYTHLQMNFIDGKYYFSNSEHIYSYDLITNQMEILDTIPFEYNTPYSRQYYSPVYKSPDNHLYGSVRSGTTEANVILYRYRITDHQFDSLARFPVLGSQIYDAVFPNDSLMIGSFDSRYENHETESIHILFQYNINSNKLDTVFNFENWGWGVHDQTWEMSHVSGMLNTHDQKVFGLFNGDKNKILFSYDTEQKIMDTIKVISYDLPINNECHYCKKKFYQLENNNFLFIEKLFAHPDYEDFHFLKFTEYSPELDLIVEERILNINSEQYWYLNDIYQFPNDLFLFQACQNPTNIEGHFDYSYLYSNNNIDTNILIPTGSLNKESDSVLRRFYSDNDEYYILRYHVFCNQIDSIRYEYSNEHLFKSHRFFKDESFLISNYFQETNTYQFIRYYYLSGEQVMMAEDDDLLNFIDEFYITDYQLIDEDYLLITAYKSENYPQHLNYLILYNFNNQSWKILYENSTNIAVMEDKPFFNQLRIENYEQNGNHYIVTFFEEDAPGGRLYNLDLEHQELIVLDEFESQYAPLAIGEMGFLKKIKKLEINYWTGLQDSNWFHPGNWSEIKVPDSSSTAHIYHHQPHLPVIDSFALCKNLIIGPNAKLTLQTKGRLSCEYLNNRGELLLKANKQNRASMIIEEAYFDDNQIYRYEGDSAIQQILSNPMETETLKSSPPYEMAAFEDQDSTWQSIQLYPFTPDENQVFKYFSTDSILEFKGQFNSQNQSLQIPQMNRENLYPLPNPYPSSINWDKSNLSSLTHKAFYYYHETDSNFTAYVDGLGTQPPLIRPLDAFWVYSDGEESVQLDLSARVHENDFQQEEVDRRLVSLQVSGVNGADKTIIGFKEDASTDFDPELDALKFLRNANPQIFTKTTDHLLTINQVPDTAMMDLFVTNQSDATLRIKLSEQNQIDFLVLEDLIWNTRHDLLNESYSFKYFQSDGHYPFKLYFEPWALEPLEEVDINIYYYPESLYISSRKQVEYAEITFYDLAGRAVYEFSESHFFHLEKPINLASGHYVVQLRSNDLVVNKKVLVR